MLYFISYDLIRSQFISNSVSNCLATHYIQKQPRYLIYQGISAVRGQTNVWHELYQCLLNMFFEALHFEELFQDTRH